ncbi:MAG TPA: hypothetical protein ENN80_02865, partial [Candidatus Hydrogenedentes bacterium]|nr:hypothetical protein [Candidatus Hydrogenedentota bacterium]
MRKLACLLPGLLLCSAALAAPLDVVDAKKLPDRWYIAPQVWANPWENWQIRDGNIVTSHASPRQPMTLHHLTCELGEAAAGAEMAVTVGLAEAQGDNAGSVGFAVGVRVNDPIDDYRSRLLFGNGMFMGLNTKGVLFIANGTRGAITAADTLNLALTKVRLIASLAPQNDGSYTVVLKATMPKSGAELGRIEKPGVPPDKLVGNVALVANAPQGVSGVAMDALWTFNEWQLNGDKFAKRPERTFGPILWSQYTLSGGVMKLTAQMAPIGERDNQSAVLEVRRESAWEQVASARIDPLSWTAPFRVDPWDASRDTAYRVVWKQAYADGTDETHYWEGAIRRDPAGKPVLTTGLFCCFMDYVFPNRCVAENVARQDPDLLMFVGDQIYENVGGWGILRTGPVDRMCVNYLRKLSLWGWSFRDLMHDRPTVVMPDDHD